jgi:hypothetical protein
MSETPRSDAQTKSADRYGDSDVVLVSIARQLERELNEARKALRETLEVLAFRGGSHEMDTARWRKAAGMDTGKDGEG